MICKPLNNCTTERRFQKGRIQDHAIGFPLPRFLHHCPPVIQWICLHHTCYFVDGDSLGWINIWACRHTNECSHSLTAEEGKNRLTLVKWLFIQANMKSMNSPPSPTPSSPQYTAPLNKVWQTQDRGRFLRTDFRNGSGWPLPNSNLGRLFICGVCPTYPENYKDTPFQI